MTKNSQYDLIIIGAGPSGMSAALYGVRKGLAVLVVAKSAAGQMSIAHLIENYPGLEAISGIELAQKMKQQAEKWGAKFVYQETVKIEKRASGFMVKTLRENFSTRAVILAFGLTPKNLNVPGEEKLTGHGVSYCATCDGPLYKNKIVAVVGGGNSALEATEYLSRLAKKVYLVHFSPQFSGDAALLSRIKKINNVELVCCDQVKEIIGDKKVTAVVLQSVIGAKNKQDLAVDGVFVEIGYQPKTAWLKSTVKLNKNGEIITDSDRITSQAGIFAAGDCTDNHYKQVVIAAADGAKAALSAERYLSGRQAKMPDWGKK